MLEITNAKYIDNYRILLEFNQGSKGIIDLFDDLWGKVFEPLHDTSLFKKFKISEISKTIEWENGADFAPEFLLSKIIKE